MRNIVLVDLDHVLSDAAWRDHLIGGEGGWDFYHSQSTNDKPVDDIAYMINALHNFGYRIVGLTGRTEAWRQLTLDWAVRYGIAMDELLMRPNKDFRPTPVVKIELVEQLIIKDQIALVFDDRDDVCAAFRARNITNLQVSVRQS